MLLKTNGAMKNNERTFQQWKELANRYFEAETSEANDNPRF